LRAAAIVMALALVPWSVSAQTAAQKQNLDEYISNLRTCAQAHASEAQATGVRTPDEAAKYFSKACIPVLGLYLLGSDVDRQNRSVDDLKDMGAPPPGISRAVFREEWSAFLERMDKR
jgi:type II secretory pathway pseudopilin PulG